MLITSFGEAQTIFKRLSFRDYKKVLLLAQRNLKVLSISDYSSKNDYTYLDQKLYIEELKEVGNDTKGKMSKEAQLTTGEVRQLRGLAGQLNWKSSQTCPNISFGACEISTSISDLIHANKNIRKLKAEQIAIQFPNLGSIEECMVVCFTDASFANLRNASSQGGYMFCIKMRKSLLQYLGNLKKFREF